MGESDHGPCTADYKLPKESAGQILSHVRLVAGKEAGKW